MSSQDAQDLTTRAASLRALADHVESLVDQAHTQSTSAMKTWAGPNADTVRGSLKSWKTTCSTVAKSLRDEAHHCTEQAKDLQNNKK
jgi:hypothetical protein